MIIKTPDVSPFHLSMNQLGGEVVEHYTLGPTKKVLSTTSQRHQAWPSAGQVSDLEAHFVKLSDQR